MFAFAWYNYAMKHSNEAKNPKTGRQVAKDVKRPVGEVPEERTDAREAFDKLLDKVSKKTTKQ